MPRSETNHPISVDSETGLYWDGLRVLRCKALIEASIESRLSEKPAHRRQTTSHPAWLDTSRAAGTTASLPT